MPSSACKWTHNFHLVPPEVAGALGPMGCSEFSSIPISCSERQRAMPKSTCLPVNIGMLSGVKCNPGPASGLAADPRYPLLSQGHRAPWASQIIKHTHFLLKMIPRSEKFLLNVGMLSAVKCHPGPSSGPTSCPRCPLKWQGHHGPWAEPHSQAYPTSCSKQC